MDCFSVLLTQIVHALLTIYTWCKSVVSVVVWLVSDWFSVEASTKKLFQYMKYMGIMWKWTIWHRSQNPTISPSSRRAHIGWWTCAFISECKPPAYMILCKWHANESTKQMSSYPWLLQQKMQFTAAIHINTANRILSTTYAQKAEIHTISANFQWEKIRDAFYAKNSTDNFCCFISRQRNVKLKTGTLRYQMGNSFSETEANKCVSLRYLAVNDRSGYFTNRGLRYTRMHSPQRKHYLLFWIVKMWSQTQIETAFLFCQEQYTSLLFWFFNWELKKEWNKRHNLIATFF